MRPHRDDSAYHDRAILPGKTAAIQAVGEIRPEETEKKVYTTKTAKITMGKERLLPSVRRRLLCGLGGLRGS
jgi:hypothetical protein